MKELGRWIADSPLRTYVDLVAFGQLTADLRLKNLLPAVQFAEENLLSFFPQAQSYLWELGSNEGLAPRGRRTPPPSLGPDGRA